MKILRVLFREARKLYVVVADNDDEALDLLTEMGGEEPEIDFLGTASIGFDEPCLIACDDDPEIDAD